MTFRKVEKRVTGMQYMTSKPGLLILVFMALGAVTYIWFKYSRGIDSLNKDRHEWESNYDSLMQQFTAYRQKLPIVAKNSQLQWSSVENDKYLTHSIDWKSFENKQLPAPDKADMHDKWIIVTTISKPTEDIQKLSQVEGWRLIVIADKKTPLDVTVPKGVVYFDVKAQENLPYNLISQMPWNNYARKGIGYIYAVHHGAKYIYETDDDNHPSDGKLHFHFNPEKVYNVYNTDRNVVNAYEYLGQSTIWPRGYPLDLIAEPPEYKVMKCTGAIPLIQQGVVNGDPDVDAIYRLTRKNKGVNIDVSFDPKQEVVLLPKNTFCPYNSQNTLYNYNAFWGLLLHASINMRVTDIWRGYWVQRMAWEIGGHISFFPPSAYQLRSAHNYLKDFKDEKELYFDSGRLVDFLLKFKSKSTTLFDQIIDLAIQMAHQGFIKPSDIHLTEAWLQDLLRSGYKMPELKPLTGKCNDIVKDSAVEKKPEEKPSSYLRAKKLIDVTKDG